eukprot:TRINITY_DN15928_c0_g1_i1.p1 TRINITY_DN15928_c0_g1~~TRINITY_DN15928_c0_g1_i1.p1  ORF type:complete len:528 (-),score=95.92 TRINITY_DN15928_c0_g1_i1:239-1822(-)
MSQPSRLLPRAAVPHERRPRALALAAGAAACGGVLQLSSSGSSRDGRGAADLQAAFATPATDDAFLAVRPRSLRHGRSQGVGGGPVAASWPPWASRPWPALQQSEKCRFSESSCAARSRTRSAGAPSAVSSGAQGDASRSHGRHRDAWHALVPAFLLGAAAFEGAQLWRRRRNFAGRQGWRDESRLPRAQAGVIEDGACLQRLKLLGLCEAGCHTVPEGLAQAFCNLFAIWIGLAGLAGLSYPSTFSAISPSWFSILLSLLMFSVGITTTVQDFKECFKQPKPVALNFFACYFMMPLLAFALAKALNSDPAILAGMVLVGAMNGGQSSNLCTLIAGGDVALSVLMTTSTTLGFLFFNPLICKLVLNTVVPIDTFGIIMSTVKVFFLPIFAGVFCNTVAPRFCKAVTPYTPVLGVLSTVALVAGSVARCAPQILAAGLPLQCAILLLHATGAGFGYLMARACSFSAVVCRTVAIETAMKSSAFGFLLASKHFGAFNARVPPALSVVWLAIVGSSLAVFWGKRPATAAS